MSWEKHMLITRVFYILSVKSSSIFFRQKRGLCSQSACPEIELLSAFDQASACLHVLVHPVSDVPPNLEN